jgi:hypothetical protein
MTNRFDLLKVVIIAAVLAGALYYLANYGLHLPS